MNITAYRIVNLITFYRLAAAPVLLLLLFFRQFDVFKWLLALSFFTDAIDGLLARRYKVVSLLGARIDSVADDITVLAAILGMMIYNLQFLLSEWPLIVILTAFYAIQNTIALIRYRKLTSFHTYIAKIAAIFQGFFFVTFYLLPQPGYVLFYLTVALTLIDLAEEILLALLLPTWQANVKGLYWVLKTINKHR